MKLVGWFCGCVERWWWWWWWWWCGVVNVKEGRGKRERGKEIERLKNYKNTKIHAYEISVVVVLAVCTSPWKVKVFLYSSYL